ncbi:MAG: hypothetical protein WCJ25_01740, partial [Candidatus Moraniibacteriota bacterium]
DGVSGLPRMITSSQRRRGRKDGRKGDWIATDAKTHPRKDGGRREDGWIATDEYALAKTEGTGIQRKEKMM